MMRTVVDNNVISDVCSDESALAICIKEGFIHHISPMAFEEQLRGVVSERSFEITHLLMRNVHKLTSNGHIMLDVKNHLKRTLGLLNNDDIFKRANATIGMFKQFLNCQNYAEFKNRFKRFIEVNHNVKFLNQKKAEEIHADFRLLKLLQSSSPHKKLFENSDIEMSFREKFAKILLHDLNLDLAANSYGIIGTLDRLPSVNYYVDCHFGLLKKYHQGMLPKGSDAIDMDYIFYLDLFDYIITNDGSFRNTLNTCGNVDLKGRAISLQDFLDSHTKLTKRAILRDSAQDLEI